MSAKKKKTAAKSPKSEWVRVTFPEWPKQIHPKYNVCIHPNGGVIRLKNRKMAFKVLPDNTIFFHFVRFAGKGEAEKPTSKHVHLRGISVTYNKQSIEGWEYLVYAYLAWKSRHPEFKGLPNFIFHEEKTK